jgi:hypothetical protein
LGNPSRQSKSADVTEDESAMDDAVLSSELSLLFALEANADTPLAPVPGREFSRLPFDGVIIAPYVPRRRLTSSAFCVAILVARIFR